MPSIDDLTRVRIQYEQIVTVEERHIQPRAIRTHGQMVRRAFHEGRPNDCVGSRVEREYFSSLIGLPTQGIAGPNLRIAERDLPIARADDIVGVVADRDVSCNFERLRIHDEYVFRHCCLNIHIIMAKLWRGGCLDRRRAGGDEWHPTEQSDKSGAEWFHLWLSRSLSPWAVFTTRIPQSGTASHVHWENTIFGCGEVAGSVRRLCADHLATLWRCRSSSSSFSMPAPAFFTEQLASLCAVPLAVATNSSSCSFQEWVKT